MRGATPEKVKKQAKVAQMLKDIKESDLQKNKKK